MLERRDTVYNRLPRPDDLGPDPEALGVRASRLLGRVASEQSRRRRPPGVPAVCPLGVAFGWSDPCRTEHCAWFRVPGTVRVCAVEQWAPHARRDARTARWFAARSDEIVEGRNVLNSRPLS